MHVNILEPYKAEMLLLYHLLCFSHRQELLAVGFLTIPVVTISLME